VLYLICILYSSVSTMQTVGLPFVSHAGHRINNPVRCVHVQGGGIPWAGSSNAN
jgi:hypothetical protein